MKPVTIWSRQERDERGIEAFHMNHIEDGHVSTERPTPKCEIHKRIWSGGKWQFEHAYLDDKNVIQRKLNGAE